MSLRSFEHALARLQKVLTLLDRATPTPSAGTVAEYSQWLSSYQEDGVCFNPDADAFKVFVAHVQQAEELARSRALAEALCSAYEGLKVLSSPALRAARCDPLPGLPGAPNELLAHTPDAPGERVTEMQGAPANWFPKTGTSVPS